MSNTATDLHRYPRRVTPKRSKNKQLSVPRHCTLDGFAHETSTRGGVEIGHLRPLTKLNVQTHNSFYHVTLLDPLRIDRSRSRGPIFSRALRSLPLRLELRRHASQNVVDRVRYANGDFEPGPSGRHVPGFGRRDRCRHSAAGTLLRNLARITPLPLSLFPLA